MTFDEAQDKLNKLSRDEYLEIYHKLGENMFSECYCPNVADFANAFGKKNSKSKDAMEKIKQITSFTGNHKDIVASCQRRVADYSEAESSKFMNSVIAANITEIESSGYFYKKCISSCDNMRIDIKYEDCGSAGLEIKLPIDKSEYDYKLQHRWITELDEYTVDYDDFCEKTKDMKLCHVRSFLTCTRSKNHRTFCKKCAGLYQREHNSSFIPKNIGIFSTLMVTEHATQASLDSMNKGVSKSLNVLLEQSIDKDALEKYENVRKKINKIIDEIGYVGVESRFYEIVLLSRMYKDKNGLWYSAPMVTSFLRQGDEFGAFIYRPSKDTFMKMLSAEKIDANSTKTAIAFDRYDDLM